MTSEAYKTPESTLAQSDLKNYKNRAIYAVLYLMLTLKVFFIYLLVFHVLPSIEGQELTVVPFQTYHQFSYFLISTICIIGLILKWRIFYFLFLLAFFANLGIYLVVGTAVYQSIIDPILLLVFILLAYYKQPNFWFRRER